VIFAADSTEYQIFMMWTDSAAPEMPWGRMRQLMSSEYVGVDNNQAGNWGHYSNPRADELIKLIPLESDPAKVKEYYTEAVEIYLTEVPSFSLMYRPNQFHVVNESVWTGYTEATDGRNVPPGHCTDGYAIADLYNLTLVNP
ncbi:MAG: ABC transporter substrate-binding protein, partial [Firmicutes bacterium]|nr:ABC transporter substrate-binding protein [Bacillota bacterium]